MKRLWLVAALLFLLTACGSAQVELTGRWAGPGESYCAFYRDGTGVWYRSAARITRLTWTRDSGSGFYTIAAESGGGWERTVDIQEGILYLGGQQFRREEEAP